MRHSWSIPRRTFLKGLGTALALPVLEAMSPATKVFASTGARKFPTRMAFVYVPNGVNMADWTPKAVGSNFDLPAILEPLAPHRSEINVLTGLALDGARAHGDGAGDHARANAAFLTGAHPRKTPGADIRAGVSVDQVAVAKLGRETRLPSLEIGCDGNKQAGACDSGYSCAYQANLSWKGESSPMPPELDPRLVFERLFGNGNSGEVKENRERRKRYQKSILDFVLEDAKQLQSNLGYTDRRKLDEYLGAVREMEIRIEQAERFSASQPNFDRPSGIPEGPNGFEKHIKLMADLLALAFETDTTRVASFMIAYDGSNRPYNDIGISEGHHHLSHHQNDQAMIGKIKRINHFHMVQFAYFLDKLKSVKEGEGTLLDNSMIVYGSGIGDGNRHNHDDLPILLAGRGGGAITPGRHIKMEKETPLTNLYLSMLDIMGASAERIGDSTGPLKGLGV
ncbi:MAG: DUF1552 domain-containing protein [Verrucomicrobia bacterium]|nr:DUF1552 domain-containing protein [Verrucomicrobiota bacterium]